MLVLIALSVIMLIVVSVQYHRNRLVWGQTRCNILNCSYLGDKCNYTVAYNNIISWFTMPRGSIGFCFNSSIPCYYNKNDIRQVCFLKNLNNWSNDKFNYNATMTTLLMIAILLTIFTTLSFCLFIIVCRYSDNQYEQI